MSAPTRITFATSGTASSISQLLNPCQIDFANLHNLRSRGKAGNDADIAPWNSERCGKKVDQGLIRHSLYGRSSHAHLEGNSLQSRDLVPRRTRLETNRESHRITGTMRVERRVTLRRFKRLRRAHINLNSSDSTMLRRKYARIGVKSIPLKAGMMRRSGASTGSLRR